MDDHQKYPTMTVGELRQILDGVPDDAPVLAETPLTAMSDFTGYFGGLKFWIEKGLAIGANTTDPGVALTLRLDQEGSLR